MLPPVDGLQFPPSVHLFLFGASLLGLAMLIVKPTNRLLMLLVVAIEVASCLPDINRWQPWQYLYLTLLFVLMIFHKNKALIQTAIAFILWSTYFFSGVFKFNGGFLSSIWEKMILIQFLHLPHAFARMSFVHYVGLLIPVIEVLGAVLLLFASTQKKGATILIVTHIFNLIFLGPIGINYNHVVWPWNAVMMVLLYLVYFRKDGHINWFTMFSKRLLWLLILWGFLPITHLFGFWDTYLSSSLYSGNTKHLSICIDTVVKSCPAPLLPFINKAPLKHNCANGVQISVTNWSLAEMGVPCYPEERVYKKLAQKLKQDYPQTSFHFIVYNYQKRIAAY